MPSIRGAPHNRQRKLYAHTYVCVCICICEKSLIEFMHMIYALIWFVNVSVCVWDMLYTTVCDLTDFNTQHRGVGNCMIAAENKPNIWL